MLLGVVAALAVGFFAFSLTSFLTGPGEQAGPTPLPTPSEVEPTPEPTPQLPSPAPTPEPPSPQPTLGPQTPTPAPPSPAPSSEPPTPQPTPTPEQKPSCPPTGVPKPDKKPPKAPEPKTWGQVDAWLAKKALYKRSVKATKCTVGRIDHQT